MATAKVTPAMSGLGRQTSVVNVLAGLELRLRDGELGLLVGALDDLGFDTEHSLRAGAAALTVEKIELALVGRGSQRAPGLAIKAHAALAAAFGWSPDVPAVQPPRATSSTSKCDLM